LIKPIGKPEGERAVEISKLKWKDNIEMDHKESDYALYSSGPGQGTVAGSCVCGNEPSGSA
jgi:hypothetical protein